MLIKIFVRIFLRFLQLEKPNYFVIKFIAAYLMIMKIVFTNFIIFIIIIFIKFMIKKNVIFVNLIIIKFNFLINL